MHKAARHQLLQAPAALMISSAGFMVAHQRPWLLLYSSMLNWTPCNLQSSEESLTFPTILCEINGTQVYPWPATTETMPKLCA